MVKESKKIPYIQLVFETKDDLLTKNALLYQDILQYQLEADKTEFQVYEDLAKWLFTKNREFLDEYSDSKAKTPMGSRFANKRDRIEAKIKDLIDLQLLAKKGVTTAQKVKVEIPLYALTRHGYFLAQMLRREKMKGKLKNAINQVIIKFMISWLRERNSSMTIFASNMYERYQNEGLIDIPLDMIKEYLFSGKPYSTVFQLIISMINMSPTNHKHLEKHWKIIHNALTSLEPNVLRIVLFTLKQTYEQQISNTHLDLVWEKLWLNYIADENTIVLMGKCRKCDQIHNVPVDTKSYLQMRLLKNFHPLIKCERCKEKDSVIVAPEIIS
jgi:hypothetical protein